MTILVIDARSRNTSAFFATGSKDANGDLVLRYASSGFIPQKEESEYAGPAECPFPILVMGTYEARSSAGPAHPLGDGGRDVTVVGGLGKPFGKGGLRRLRRPIKGRMMPSHCRVHAWDGNSSSNPGSAGATIEAIKFMAQVDRDSLWLVEGQSDWERSIRLEPTKDSAYPEFEDEFQQGVFDPAVGPVRNALFGLLPERKDEYGADGNRVEPTHHERETRKRQFEAAVWLVDEAWVAGDGACLPQLAAVREELGDEAFGRALNFLRSQIHDHYEAWAGVDTVFVTREQGYEYWADGVMHPAGTETVLVIPAPGEEVAAVRGILAPAQETSAA